MTGLFTIAQLSDAVDLYTAGRGHNDMDMQRIGEFDSQAGGTSARRTVGAFSGAIGEIIEISRSSSQVRFDAAALSHQTQADDPCLATAGQVGSQIKARLGSAWLVANVRSLRRSWRRGCRW